MMQENCKLKQRTLYFIVLLGMPIFIYFHIIQKTFDAKSGEGEVVNKVVLQIREDNAIRRADSNIEKQKTLNRPIKNILIWADKFGEKSKFIFKKLSSSQCPVNECQVIHGKTLLKIADAVIFTSWDIAHNISLPLYHQNNQSWIFFSSECPDTMIHNQGLRMNKLNDDVFNWTMTYRLDSDIHYSSGYLKPKISTEYQHSVKQNKRNIFQDKSREEINKNYWQEKNTNKFAVWLVSHCNTNGKREHYVQQLLKHMNVHIFGKCSNRKCGLRLTADNVLKNPSANYCQEEISKYFFYFAFENGICEDYVSEKLYKALDAGVVPVVYGGADYSKFAPHNSYINAMDFLTPKLLAEHLKFIAANEVMYNQYFAWKKDFTIEFGHPINPDVCDLCAKLHEMPLKFNPEKMRNTSSTFKKLIPPIRGKNGETSYPSIYNWFVVAGDCRRPLMWKMYMNYYLKSPWPLINKLLEQQLSKESELNV